MGRGWVVRGGGGDSEAGVECLPVDAGEAAACAGGRRVRREGRMLFYRRRCGIRLGCGIRRRGIPRVSHEARPGWGARLMMVEPWTVRLAYYCLEDSSLCKLHVFDCFAF